MPLRLYFIRHGETEWSLSGQYTGRTDIPLTAHGEDEARKVGQRLRGIPFAHVLTSPLQRARQTCELAELEPMEDIAPDLAEWDNGDDEGRTPAEVSESRPDWNLFRDGSPNGETPAQISDRADRFIAQLRTLDGNVALFSHSHFGRVLAARWIGLPVAQAQHFLLNTASISVLCYEHESIWISHCPMALEGFKPRHLSLFNSHHRLATPVSPWEKLKIGGGSPPILTRHGWLIVHYGMPDSRIGVAPLIVPKHLPSGAPADADGPKTGGEG